MRILLRVALGLVLVAALAVGAALAQRAIAQRRTLAETAIDAPGLDSVESVEIGGVPQKVMIRSRSAAAPVLVYLHDGTGLPFLPEARERLGALEENFIVVSWAQRGCLGSYRPGMEPLTLERVVADTLTLVHWARWRLGAPRVMLLGESWGSLPGALAAARLSEELLGYVGVSQIVHLGEALPQTYDWLLERAREAGDAGAMRRLSALAAEGAIPGSTAEQYLEIVGWVRHFGGSAPPPGAKGGSAAFVREYLAPAWLSPDYSLRELAHTARDPLFGARVLEDALGVDVRRAAARMTVPAYLFAGDLDPLAPLPLIQSYLERLDAPMGKEIAFFHGVGHDLREARPEQFVDTLLAALRHARSVAVRSLRR